jgi:hypothetical protein
MPATYPVLVPSLPRPRLIDGLANASIRLIAKERRDNFRHGWQGCDTNAGAPRLEHAEIAPVRLPRVDGLLRRGEVAGSLEGFL